MVDGGTSSQRPLVSSSGSGHHRQAVGAFVIVKRRRLVVGGIAQHVEIAAVGERRGDAEGRFDAGLVKCCGDLAQHGAGGAGGIVVQAARQHQQEEDLAVRRALALRIEVVGDQPFQRPPDHRVLADLAVVHEEPAAVREGVAIGPAGCRPGGGADMSEEHRRRDVARQRAQVAVVPGRQDLVIGAGFGPRAVPAHAEAVAVGRDLAFLGVQALLDQRMVGRVQKVFHVDRGAAIGQPTAHLGKSLRTYLRGAPSYDQARANAPFL